ncbi:hypothetical protein OK016_05710 [Vibrio chagasii]|nr:hypothetical protein [Vibrio chagasii]
MQSMQNLFSEYGLHLNSPSFATPNDDIGFVTRVYQGVKRMALSSSHPNPWAWVAEAKLGRGDRAMKFYDALNPYNQNDMIETRHAEPTVMRNSSWVKTTKTTVSNPPLVNRYFWLGILCGNQLHSCVRTGFEGLTVDPCIPTDWPEFEVTRQWRATYNITVQNPNAVSKGVASINGQR